MLFFVSTISSVVYLRCRMQIQAKPMNRKRFWSCLLSNGGRNCSKRVTAWPFLIQYKVWLPLYPKTKIDGKRNGLFCEDLYLYLLYNTLRSCLNLCPWNFYRSFLGCFFIFQRRIAGYVTAKKGKTDKKGHKKTSTSWGQCK